MTLFSCKENIFKENNNANVEKFKSYILVVILFRIDISGCIKKCDIESEILINSAKDNNISWCFGGSLKVLNPPGPVTGLFSYPGSGNTWLREQNK